MRRTFVVAVAAGLFATYATADPINIPYMTTGTTLNFVFPYGGGDTLTLTGTSGSLALSDAGTSTANILTGTYTTVPTFGTGVQSLNMTYDLTLDGVTHTLIQPANWTITWGPDTFVAGSGAPVDFDTPMGLWSVTPDAFTIDNGAVAGTIRFAVQADFVDPPSLPEPGTLFGTLCLFAGLLLMRRRQFARS